MQYQVRTATVTDADAIVARHLEAFPDFNLSKLGPKFLRHLYLAMLADGQTVCLVAAAESRVIGFIVGPMAPASFFSQLFRASAFRFLGAAVPALARRPMWAMRLLLRAVFYRGEEPPTRVGLALVSSVAVAPDARGAGVAGGLLEAFCAQARERVRSGVYLTTDATDNAVANQFYAKHQFVLESIIQRHDGRRMNRYVRIFEPGATKGNRVS
jgi:colanic acid biosynthesis glycosyl transferase WcaI